MLYNIGKFHSPSSNTFQDMNYYPVWFLVKSGQTDRQTDRALDTKQRIWVHRAKCTGGLKNDWIELNLLPLQALIKNSFGLPINVSTSESSPTISRVYHPWPWLFAGLNQPSSDPWVIMLTATILIPSWVCFWLSHLLIDRISCNVEDHGHLIYFNSVLKPVSSLFSESGGTLHKSFILWRRVPCP